MEVSATNESRIADVLLSLAASVLLTIAAAYIEPRLVPLAVAGPPALVGLFTPPGGRRVYRELGAAALSAGTVAALLLFAG